MHRDVYIDEEVFQLEMEHVFANAWVYVGHDSQTPNPGDFYGTTIGAAAGPDGPPHRRDRASPAQPLPAQGHAHHRRDLRQCRQVLPLPLSRLELQDRRLAARDAAEEGLREHRLRASHAAQGMAPVRHVHNYRGFVFAKHRATSAPAFEEFFGESLSSLDNMIDRSPAGRLEVAGGVLRYMHNCNWKMLVENQTDTCHPMVAHESSAGTAVDVWKKAPPGTNEADGGRDLRALHEPLRVLREHGHPRLGQRPRAYRRAHARSTPIIRPCPAISRRWSRPMARRAPRRFSTRTGTTPSISPM